MKIFFTLTILSCLVFGCTEDENAISGKWKLNQVNFPMTQVSNDLSNEEIIYHFQTDNTLVVSGNNESHGIHENGEYTYSFGEGHLISEEDPLSLIVKINDSKWTYDLTGSTMTLGRAYMDLEEAVFERE